MRYKCPNCSRFSEVYMDYKTLVMVYCPICDEEMIREDKLNCKKVGVKE